MFREVFGYGTLFRQSHLMFSESFRVITIDVFNDYDGFLLAILPPGAFMVLALLIAMRNRIDRSAQARNKVISVKLDALSRNMAS